MTSAQHEPDLRGASVFFAGAFFNVREDGRVEACPVSEAPVETFTPGEFRERLALLARLADEAQDEALIGDLAKVISSVRCADYRTLPSPEAFARAALQWMRQRREVAS